MNKIQIEVINLLVGTVRSKFNLILLGFLEAAFWQKHAIASLRVLMSKVAVKYQGLYSCLITQMKFQKWIYGGDLVSKIIYVLGYYSWIS